MPEFFLKDFSAGWCPSDDAMGGRKNALLRMDSLELDKNGAVSLTGGTTRIVGAFSNTLHSIYSRFLGVGTQYRYSGDTSGNIFRNTTNIGSGGSSARCGFGSAYNFVIICSGNLRKRDDGTTATNLGQTATSAPGASLNGAGVLTGDLEYIQINIYSSGAYQARSAPSPLTSITATDNKVQITPQNVSGSENEVWIFRRGGTLDLFYRVKRITSSYTTPFDDNLEDQDALNSGIIGNLNALSINSTDLPDAILEVVGPINNRMLYFTATAVNFSEVNSPETYVPGQSIYFMGSATTSESFLWAKKLGNNVVLIGTTHDVYRLTGTMVSLPDGTLDVYIKPLGVDAAPISIDADIYQNNVVYMSAYGWVMCDINGNIIQLCAPNTDRIYRGETCYTVGGVPIILNQERYSCAVIRNKLYVRVPQIVNNNPATTYTYRCEVYDFVRKYWRTIQFASNNAPKMLFSQEDDAVIGFFDDDKYIKQLDWQFGKTWDNSGGAANPIVSFLTTFQDCDAPRNRKDVYTLKFKISTGSSNLAATLYVDNDITNSSGISLGNINTASLQEVEIDLSGVTNRILKNFQILLSGTVADFLLTDISLTYDLRPTQSTFLRVIANNLGSLGRKRLTDFAFVINTLGNNVTLTPYVDNSALSNLTLNSAYKKTINYPYSADSIGTDFEFTLSSGGSNLFEFYELLYPKDVESFPTPYQFYTMPITNFGTPARKRMKSGWGVVVDGRGNTVTWTPIIDGNAQTPVSIAGTGKATFYFYPTTDKVGVDFSGTFSSSGFFEIWQILTPDFEILPIRGKFYQATVTNFGVISKKRLRVLALNIDPLGGSITFTPFYDGSSGATSTFNGTGKQTFYHFISTDINMLDFYYTLSSTTAFEFYNELTPEAVQALMPPKRFDQLGPEEFFRYGKIKLIRFRILSDSTANIPYNIFFQDGSVTTGNLSTVAHVEDTYEIQPPFTTAGRILRIELGPTAFNFYRYYAEIQVAKTGSDTNYQWVQLPVPQQQQ